jgi:nucleoside-triphosphatase THEP1
MKIAYTMMSGRGDVDGLLFAVSQDLIARGHRIAGAVQSNTPCAQTTRCDMDIRVLPDGPDLRISQNLGAGSSGCRLDTSALEVAVGLVSARLDAGTDLLIINKFGKHEADGRGFRPVIAEALSNDIPVLVGVNALSLEAFRDFAADMAEYLRPDEGDLINWFKRMSAVAA